MTSPRCSTNQSSPLPLFLQPSDPLVEDINHTHYVIDALSVITDRIDETVVQLVLPIPLGLGLIQEFIED